MLLASLNDLYAALPTGHDAPADDRAFVDACGGRNAHVYGEISDEALLTLLRWLRPGPDDRLIDLGSGVGRLPIAAALLSDVGRAIGVELSLHRHAVAAEALRRIEAGALGDACRHRAARIELRNEDLQDTDLDGVTIAYAGSTCFSPALVAGLARRCAAAPHLRRLITSHPLTRASLLHLEPIGHVHLPMSWAPRVPVHVYAPRR